MISNKESSNKGYQKLIAWQLADRLAQEVYTCTNKFPKEEVYGVTSQLRRAVLSVPLNVVEGYARNSENDFRRFLKIALGSLAETEYLLYFSVTRRYLKDEDYNKLSRHKEECGKVIWKLMKAL